MKLILAYILFLAFSIQIAGNLITIAAFELNKDFIAKNLCVNRNKPKIHCNGKCHLMKELQKGENKNDIPGSCLKDKNESVQYFESTFETIFANESTSNLAESFYIESKTITFKNSVFRPPLG